MFREGVGCKVIECCGTFRLENSHHLQKMRVKIDDISVNTQQVDSPEKGNCPIYLLARPLIEYNVSDVKGVLRSRNWAVQSVVFYTVLCAVSQVIHNIRLNSGDTSQIRGVPRCLTTFISLLRSNTSRKWSTII